VFGDVGEERQARGFEVLEAFVVAVVQHLLTKILPQSLDQVQVRAIRRQEDPLDLRRIEERRHELRAVIPSVVADHVDRAGLAVLALDLLEQIDRRLGVDARVDPRDGVHLLEVDRPVDIEPLAAGVGGDLFLDAPLDPPTRRGRIVLRVHAVHQVDGVVFALVWLDVFVLIEERALRFGVGFAWDDLGLLGHKTPHLSQH